ncbi:hypothetical protein [Leptolyngbya sp. Heron Island J]|uniref:hypothetical protein n=1 Tax=Leptolyngbya sp. Heron Island J TaxID=1385935 RepID=UPI0004250379|nr:hypothetical protein [Leptolyngbya sp. Heron Island J]
MLSTSSTDNPTISAISAVSIPDCRKFLTTCRSRASASSALSIPLRFQFRVCQQPVTRTITPPQPAMVNPLKRPGPNTQSQL